MSFFPFDLLLIGLGGESSLSQPTITAFLEAIQRKTVFCGYCRSSLILLIFHMAASL